MPYKVELAWKFMENLMTISKNKSPIRLKFYRQIALTKVLTDPEFQGDISYGLVFNRSKWVKMAPLLLIRYTAW